MIVCHCRRVNHLQVLAAIHDGARSVEEVGEVCGACTGCGGCRASVEALLEQSLGPDAITTPEPLPTDRNHAA